MVVGVGIIDIYIFNSRSLKEKRGVLRRVMKRTQNRFNISIAEIGNNDNWKRGRVGFSVVGNDTGYINSKMDNILKFIDNLELAELVSSKVEIVSFSNVIDQGAYIRDDYGQL
jgi:hypothetical protein